MTQHRQFNMKQFLIHHHSTRSTKIIPIIPSFWYFTVDRPMPQKTNIYV